MGVMKQAALALSPRETLVADTHMLVRDELRPGMAVLLLVLQVGIQHAQTHGRKGNEEGQFLPGLVATTLKKKKSVTREHLPRILSEQRKSLTSVSGDGRRSSYGSITGSRLGNGTQ